MPFLCLLVLGSRDTIFWFLAFFFFSLSGCVIYSIHSVISQDKGGHQYSRRITLNADHWLFFFFWLLHVALLFSHVWFFETPWTAARQAESGILVAWPGIEPMPPEVEARSLNHRTAREVSRDTVKTRGIKNMPSGVPIIRGKRKKRI